MPQGRKFEAPESHFQGPRVPSFRVLGLTRVLSLKRVKSPGSQVLILDYVMRMRWLIKMIVFHKMFVWWFYEKKHKTENCRVLTEPQARKAIIKNLIKSKISCFIHKYRTPINRHHAKLCSNDKKEENSSLTSLTNFQGSSIVLL